MSNVQATGYYHAPDDKFATAFQIKGQANYVSIMHGNDWFFSSNIETETVDQDGVGTVVTINGHLQTIPFSRVAASATITAVRNSEANPAGEIGYEITVNGEVVHSNPVEPLQWGSVAVDA